MKFSSFKGEIKMARITDPKKIENIKKATMEIIIEKGYSNATIAAIAKRAGVSLGYLYRHYSSKVEFMEEFVHTTSTEFLLYSCKLMNNCKDIKEIFNKHITYLADIANNNPTLMLFYISLFLDIRYITRIQFIDLEVKIAKEFIEKGRKTGEINSNLTVAQLTSVYPTIPLKYMGVSISNESSKVIGTEDIERLVEMCMNALK